MKNLYLIIGKSGTGKTTLSRILEKRYGMKPVASYTTRPRRPNEEDGHIFVSDKEFDALGEMVAYTDYNGYRYGVTKDLLDRCDLYVVDPVGARVFREKYQDRRIVSIGLYVDPKTRAERMRERGDSEDRIYNRLIYDEKAFNGFEAECDYLLCTRYSADFVAGTIEDIINKEEKEISKCRL